jgi:hypothetical protein
MKSWLGEGSDVVYILSTIIPHYHVDVTDPLFSPLIRINSLFQYPLFPPHRQETY